MHPVLAELLGAGPELFIVFGIIALLFGGSKIPQFARSLGQAKHEFEKGTHETAATPVVAPAAALDAHEHSTEAGA